MKKTWLTVLVAAAAIMIAGSAAYFSVTGLGVLFSGAAVAVMIMAGSLEFAKLVTATYLKQNWIDIKGLNKWYLTTAVVILMVITSAGIFGYLSNAFQQQNLKLDQVQREISVWQNKIEYSNQQITTLQGQQKDLTTTQSSLITKGNVNSRLLKSVDNRDRQAASINKKINSLQDSIVAYNGKINDVKNNNINIEREVGGFRFVAEAFGVELKSVVKFFIILIVVVFDPLAVALVISFNQLVMVPIRKKDEEQSTEEPIKVDAPDLVAEVSRIRLSEDDLKILENALLNPPKPNDALKEAAENYRQEIEKSDREPFGEMMFSEDNARMDIIGQNGNEGLHYNDDELMKQLEEAIIASQELLKETLKPELLNDTPISVEERKIDLKEIAEKLKDRELFFPELNQSAKEIAENAIWDVTLMDGLEDEPPYVSDDFTIGPDGAFEMTEEILKELNEEFTNIEPTEEEEQLNFSTIESNLEYNFLKEDYPGQFKDWEDEIALDNELTRILNEVQSETFSDKPTKLDVPIEEEPIFTIDDAPYEEFLKEEKALEIEETSTQPNIEVEKKKS